MPLPMYVHILSEWLRMMPSQGEIPQLPAGKLLAPRSVAHKMKVIVVLPGKPNEAKSPHKIGDAG